MAGWAVGGVGRDIDSLWRDQPNFLAERLFTISLKENNHQSYRTYFFFLQIIHDFALFLPPLRSINKKEKPAKS